MNRIFSDAKDLYVETTFVYLKAGESTKKLYKDPECAKGLTMVETKDLFHKGMTIVDHEDGVEVYYKPVCMIDTTTAVKVVYYNTSAGSEAYAADSAV